jgi:hypothetical protein
VGWTSTILVGIGGLESDDCDDCDDPVEMGFDIEKVHKAHPRWSKRSHRYREVYAWTNYWPLFSWPKRGEMVSDSLNKPSKEILPIKRH